MRIIFIECSIGRRSSATVPEQTALPGWRQDMLCNMSRHQMFIRQKEGVLRSRLTRDKRVSPQQMGCLRLGRLALARPLRAASGRSTQGLGLTSYSACGTFTTHFCRVVKRLA